LQELSKKGHFLKGSSASIGLCKVKTLCEAIQHLGMNKDPFNGMTLIPNEEALAKISHFIPILNELLFISKKTLDEMFGSVEEAAFK
jgi:osomolarity two-component system phosphorelay intermediate protein YPD1